MATGLAVILPACCILSRDLGQLNDLRLGPSREKRKEYGGVEGRNTYSRFRTAIIRIDRERGRQGAAFSSAPRRAQYLL